MFCRYCGKKIDEGSKFCQYCGRKLDFEDQYKGEIKNEVERSDGSKHSKKLWITIVIIISIVAILISGLYFFEKSKEEAYVHFSYHVRQVDDIDEIRIEDLSVQLTTFDGKELKEKGFLKINVPSDFKVKVNVNYKLSGNEINETKTLFLRISNNKEKVFDEMVFNTVGFGKVIVYYQISFI